MTTVQEQLLTEEIQRAQELRRIAEHQQDNERKEVWLRIGAALEDQRRAWRFGRRG